MKALNILLGCEESQIMCQEFRNLGHSAYSCDLQKPSGNLPQYHLQMDIFEAIELKKWDLAIFFPPCTYLTVSSNRWYKDQPKRESGVLVGHKRRQAREKAIQFVFDLFHSDIDHIGLENPIGVLSTRWRKPNQIIHPWMFGHPEQKATCLWLKNLPKLKPTNIVYKEMMNLPIKDRQRIWWDGEGSKNRSKSYRGIAKAMAAQWSEYILGNPKTLIPLL